MVRKFDEPMLFYGLKTKLEHIPGFTTKEGDMLPHVCASYPINLSSHRSALIGSYIKQIDQIAK